MKQKSSTAASSLGVVPEQAAAFNKAVDKAAFVLLRNLDTKDSESFAPDHAERLLKYPGTRFAAIDAGNVPAGAAATAPAAPSEADATGHPTEV